MCIRDRAIINATLFGTGRVIQVQSSYLKHSTSSLSVRRSDQWRMEIIETSIVEKLVDGIGHMVPDPKYR